MPRKTLPTSADLAMFLISTGLPNLVSLGQNQQLEGTYDTPSIMAAAIAEWENRTFFHPFLTTGVLEKREFDGQGRNEIEWSGGLCSTLADGTPTVPIDGSPSIYTLTINGSIYATNFYSYKPNIAPNIGKPYTRIKFGRLQDSWLPVANGPTEDGITFLGNAQRVIAITGYWGYGFLVPDDAWLAMIQYGASLLMQQIGMGVHQGLTSWTEAGVTQAYNPKVYDGVQASWEANFNRTVQRYRRVSL